jgi:hypothetical protein
VALSQANQMLAAHRAAEPNLPVEIQQIGWLARRSEVRLIIAVVEDSLLLADI